MLWKFLFHAMESGTGVGAVGRAAARGGSAGSVRARTCAPGRGCVRVSGFPGNFPDWFPDLSGNCG
jgi:hypothetical protein